jgi:hypothetical protein
MPRFPVDAPRRIFQEISSWMPMRTPS